jgi:hypothetical protein
MSRKKRRYYLVEERVEHETSEHQPIASVTPMLSRRKEEVNLPMLGNRIKNKHKCNALEPTLKREHK